MICDKCWNYEVHPSGVIEKCHRVHIDLTPDYIEHRMNGNTNYCTKYEKLPKEIADKK